MKLVLTEQQIKLIKSRINENVTPIEEYEKFCLHQSQEMNKLFSKVSSLTINDILDKNVDIDKLIDYLYELEYVILRDKTKRVYAYLDSIDIEDMDLRVDEAQEKLSNKIEGLNNILEGFKHLKNLIDERGVADYFKDIETISVGFDNKK